jgi:elongation factor Ts
MATVTAALVNQLRQMTGAGMMECKKALDASDGDIEKAIKSMREQGQAKAVKKAGRIAAEGLIVVSISTDRKNAAMTEVNCETDFVARDDGFIKFANAVALTALQGKVKDIATLASAKLDSDSAQTVEQSRETLVGKIGENIQIRRTVYLESSDYIGSYLHNGRIGVIVNLKGGNPDIAKDIAMHIAASNPLVVAPTDVSHELIEKEKDIAVSQAKASGKPDNIIQKMVDGRINKFLDEVSLIGQPFVKDPDQTIGKLLEAAKAQVLSFTRFEVGEGIEKPVENFADEVKATAQGAS